MVKPNNFCSINAFYDLEYYELYFKKYLASLQEHTHTIYIHFPK